MRQFTNFSRELIQVANTCRMSNGFEAMNAPHKKHAHDSRFVAFNCGLAPIFSSHILQKHIYGNEGYNCCVETQISCDN